MPWRPGMPTHCSQCMSPDLEYLEDGSARCRVCGRVSPPAWAAAPARPAAPPPSPPTTAPTPPAAPVPPLGTPPPAYATGPPPGPPPGYGWYPPGYGWYPPPSFAAPPYQNADFSTIFSHTFRVFRRHPLEFVLPYFAFALVISAVIFVALFATIGAGGIVLDPTNPMIIPMDAIIALVGGVLVVAFVALFIGQIVDGTVTHFAVLRHRNAPASLGTSLRRVVQRIVPLLGATFLYALIFLGLFGAPIALFLLGLATLNLAFLGIGAIALIIAIPFGIFLSIALSLYVPAIMMEEVGPVDSLRRSWALTKGHRLSLFGAYIVIGLLGSVVSFAVSLPVALLGDPIVNLLAQSVALGLVGSWVVIAAAVAYDLIVSQPAYPMWYGPWAPPPTPAAPAVPPAPPAGPASPPPGAPPAP